jgi:hypothetical protein
MRAVAWSPDCQRSHDVGLEAQRFLKVAKDKSEITFKGKNARYSLRDYYVAVL